MGAIPSAMIEQNVHLNIRGYIYIASGYNSHWRRGLDYNRRGSTDAYIEVRSTDVYIDSCNRISHRAKAD
jgi:hypothetical protein